MALVVSLALPPSTILDTSSWVARRTVVAATLHLRLVLAHWAAMALCVRTKLPTFSYWLFKKFVLDFLIQIYSRILEVEDV
jgi:hypothetical protein